ncbi:MAG: tungsten ABC transporter permease [Hyperthermus sp.]|nr:MAG: tungsten ABC transporter permease [Hyperthermus sp.]
MSRRILAVIVVAAAIIALYLSTLSGSGPVRVRAATTTSLYATGLLDYLASSFSRQHPSIRVEFIAVGSGQALRLASRGDACLVLVHAPSLEKKYINSGVIVREGFLAYNFFAVVGPSSDPAAVRGAESIIDAFKRIYESGENGRILFISRGDRSGTHTRELSIWRLAGLDPRGRPWYLESGQGMAETLVMAEEKGAYTLTDMGTFLKLKREGLLPDLEVLYTNVSELINIYSVYLVSSCKGREARGAEMFADFILSHQELVENYGVAEYGAHLFYPANKSPYNLTELWNKLSTLP